MASGEVGEIRPTVCFWCKAECGLLAHVRDGELLRLEEDPDWPIKCYPPTKGCVRRKAAAEYFYHPGRVNYPMKRTGRGEKASGRGSRGRTLWTRSPANLGSCGNGMARRRWPPPAAPPAPTMSTGPGSSICSGRPICSARNASASARVPSSPTPSVGMFPNYAVSKDTNCVLLLGAEPLKARPMAAKGDPGGEEAGRTMIVVDPCQTQSARMADIWLPLRPGTDSALLLGMIRVIVEEACTTGTSSRRWCFGFDRLSNVCGTIRSKGLRDHRTVRAI